jgi:type VI secretion system protein ImpG
MRINDEELLRYYQEELLYLRRDGKTFAHSYPKIAARLELHGHESPDPHVERLIESFAFLTARIRRNLDDDFPEIGAELLNILYPQYLLPIPSLTIARFDVDWKDTTLTSGKLVPQNTKLFAQSTHGAICRWRTTAPLTLWPIEITGAEIESPDLHDFLHDRSDVRSVLRLRLLSHGQPFEKLGLDQLRFHLHGDTTLTQPLYELLFDDSQGVVHPSVMTVTGSNRKVCELPRHSLRAGGFGEEEELLPYPPQAHPAYRLLQEYFAFPEKFHFVDVENLTGNVSGEEIDLLFLLGSVPASRMKLKIDRRNGRTLVETGTFVLGCAPIVNLFEKTSEPIRIDHRRLQYRLVGDIQREETTEIHSVRSVSGSVNPADPNRQYAPFYSWSHDMSRRAQRIFWHARREMSLDNKLPGTETWLSFVDLDFSPGHPPEEIVWAHTLCTNRGLAAELPAGTWLQTDVSVPVSHIVCLRNPTREIQPPLGGRTLWSVVSHLSLNYLSLADSQDKQQPLQALREILRLYCTSGHPALDHQIDGLKEVKVRKVVRRFGDDMRRGFARGTEVTITVDDSAFVGGSAYLFMSILNQFFSLYASTNSFTQLVVHKAQREGAWKQWPPTAGGRAVL